MANKKQAGVTLAKSPKEDTTSKQQASIATLLKKKIDAHMALMKKYGATEDDPLGGRIASNTKEVLFQPTGLPVLDEEVLGIGGLPVGRMLEIYGVKSSGKTSVALYFAGCIQKTNPAAIIKMYDKEHSWTDPWGASMGMDLGRTFLPKSSSAENMSEQIQADIASKFPPDIIIVDSIAAMQPELLQKKTVGDQGQYENYARANFMKKFCDSLTDGFYYPPMGKDKRLPAGSKLFTLDNGVTTLIFINHAKLVTKSAGGASWTEWVSTGGVSLDFHAVIQLMTKKIGVIKSGSGDNQRATHQKISIRADKNKVAPPLRKCELKLSFEGGIEQVGSIDYLQMALNKKLVEMGGAGWITGSIIPDGKMQGKEKFNAMVHATPILKERITTATHLI